MSAGTKEMDRTLSGRLSFSFFLLLCLFFLVVRVCVCVFLWGSYAGSLVGWHDVSGGPISSQNCSIGSTRLRVMACRFPFTEFSECAFVCGECFQTCFFVCLFVFGIKKKKRNGFFFYRVLPGFLFERVSLSNWAPLRIAMDFHCFVDLWVQCNWLKRDLTRNKGHQRKQCQLRTNTTGYWKLGKKKKTR